jgi:hypothetical protein
MGALIHEKTRDTARKQKLFTPPTCAFTIGCFNAIQAINSTDSSLAFILLLTTMSNGSILFIFTSADKTLDGKVVVVVLAGADVSQSAGTYPRRLTLTMR